MNGIGQNPIVNNMLIPNDKKRKLFIQGVL